MQSTVEFRQVDISRPVNLTKAISLSNADASCWSGILESYDDKCLKLPKGICDIYVMSGAVLIGDQWYSEGTFVAGWSEGSIDASKQSRLLVYRHDIKFSVANPSIFLPESLIWHPGSVTGIRIASLTSLHHFVSLISWDPNAQVNFHDHPYGEEIFVLRGQLQDQKGKYPAGSWLRLYPGTGHAPFAEESTLILLRNGHLRIK